MAGDRLIDEVSGGLIDGSATSQNACCAAKLQLEMIPHISLTMAAGQNSIFIKPFLSPISSISTPKVLPYAGIIKPP